jgi:sigma-B regulation protein RsbU (phosphoserine phosphatase)
MRVLIAEDELFSRRLLQKTLESWGYEVSAAKDGAEALAFALEHNIRLVIADWMMPVMDGEMLCKEIRKQDRPGGYTYFILLTAKQGHEDLVRGLKAGADDYLTKPFEPEELKARLRAGERVVRLENQLAERIEGLEKALAHVRELQGLLPICMYCKKIRDDQNYWHRVEDYVSNHSSAVFSHSVCPDCYEEHLRSAVTHPEAGPRGSATEHDEPVPDRTTTLEEPELTTTKKSPKAK